MKGFQHLLEQLTTRWMRLFLSIADPYSLTIDKTSALNLTVAAVLTHIR
ncbi:hypothetical protein [Microcoleus sp. K4-C2]